MEKTSPRLAYEIPYLAKLVHSLPRVDLSLNRVNATFLLDRHDYKEVCLSAVLLIVNYKAVGDWAGNLLCLISGLVCEDVPTCYCLGWQYVLTACTFH